MTMYRPIPSDVEAEPISVNGSKMMAFSVAGRRYAINSDVFNALFVPTDAPPPRKRRPPTEQQIIKRALRREMEPSLGDQITEALRDGDKRVTEILGYIADHFDWMGEERQVTGFLYYQLGRRFTRRDGPEFVWSLK